MNPEISGPLPARLVFLSEISGLLIGTKVRFLGCVSKYIVSQGILILEHIQSIESPSKNAFHSPKTTIDVKPNLLLGALKHTDIDVGNWINVIGYVRQQPPVPKENSRKRTNEDAQVYIEAVMIIPAGPIRIGEYEKIVAESRDVNRRLKMPNNNGPG